MVFLLLRFIQICETYLNNDCFVYLLRPVISFLSLFLSSYSSTIFLRIPTSIFGPITYCKFSDDVLSLFKVTAHFEVRHSNYLAEGKTSPPHHRAVNCIDRSDSIIVHLSQVGSPRFGLDRFESGLTRFHRVQMDTVQHCWARSFVYWGFRARRLFRSLVRSGLKQWWEDRSL